ncbi:MAG: 2-oxo acid dehydrogenase subunit E2 [Chloroflexi bacterium]|nr:2-oxo acid dehydrogenase subunit E2 [Chloroflexota bacterium]
MATDVIMPALGVAQESGKVIRWYKTQGQSVEKGELLLAIETDKTTVDIETPATGKLGRLQAPDGSVVPVGQVIAVILAPDETETPPPYPVPDLEDRIVPHTLESVPTALPSPEVSSAPLPVSPIAARIAADNQIDLGRIHPRGARIEKADVLAYLESRRSETSAVSAGRVRASPKARRLAFEHGIELTGVSGSGPAGAVLASDIPLSRPAAAPLPSASFGLEAVAERAVSNVWHIMAERTTQSWTGVPHFYLVRHVVATRLISWRAHLKAATEGITYTDLLVRLVSAALQRNRAVNAMWQDEKVIQFRSINIGLAVALEDGLVVPVIHDADRLSVAEIAAARRDLVERARSNRLKPQDIADGTMTISNMGMYGVDYFHAILNPPQATILAVGRIADGVLAENGLPVVRPMMTLSLSCDHRVVDGARGARFLETIADLIEEPAGLIE